MPLCRAIPLFLNSGIFAAIGYGNSGNFTASSRGGVAPEGTSCMHGGQKNEVLSATRIKTPSQALEMASLK